MGERRALVIGARNDRFGVLNFVDDVARELHQALMDGDRGACLPALPDGRDLLIGGTASCGGIDSALADSISAAAADQATLFIYFLGHGRQRNQDFYLIGADTGQRVDSKTAVQIGQRIKELLDAAATIDGLMLVLDACHSGAAITDPVPGLLRTGVHGRLEILAATREDQTASKGCFTRSILSLLTQGSPASANEYLTAYDEHSRLREAAPPDCADMPAAVHVSICGGPDAGLWLGRNRVADLQPALLGAQDSAQVAHLTRSLVYTPYLNELMRLRLSGQSPIGIAGSAGVGKSVLLSALGRTSVAGIYGINALAGVRPGDTLASVTGRLAEQLQKSQAFRDAAARWTTRTPAALREAAPLFESAITGPVSQLAAREQLLIGVDGIDQLGTIDRRRLLDAFRDTSSAVLVVAGRTMPEVDSEAVVRLPATDQESVAELLVHLVDDVQARSRISAFCGGEWLLARILAGLWRAGHLEPSLDQDGLEGVFSAAVAVARVNRPDERVDDLLAILAAAPPGAWMPLDLIVATLADDRKFDRIQVRDILVALGELITRADPGRGSERVGPAHDLIAAHFAAMVGPDQLAAVHGKLADIIIAVLATHSSSDITSYAGQALADHLWKAKRYSEAIGAVGEPDTPADKLALWQLWGQRVLSLGLENPVALRVRYNIAFWALQAGDMKLALAEFTSLLPDETRILGADHRDTLATRHGIAVVTGQAGDARTALKQINTLLLDAQRALEPDDKALLAIRISEATMTGQTGDFRSALKKLNALLPDIVRVYGAEDSFTLDARINSAAIAGQVNGARAGLKQLHELLPDLIRVYGPDDVRSLTARNNQAKLTLLVGDPEGALTMYEELFTSRSRLLGADHFSTLVTRAGIAQCLAESGKTKAAIETYNILLRDQTRILGPHHPETVTTRHNLAICIDRSGDLKTALEQLADVLKDRLRILGPNHPDTIITQNYLLARSASAKDDNSTPSRTKRTKKRKQSKGKRRRPR
jgi:tetratricopeptide (TPR) repeat protein